LIAYVAVQVLQYIGGAQTPSSKQPAAKTVKHKRLLHGAPWCLRDLQVMGNQIKCSSSLAQVWQDLGQILKHGGNAW